MSGTPFALSGISGNALGGKPRTFRRDISTVTTYREDIFTGPGTWTCPSYTTSVDVLIVGGGGGRGFSAQGTYGPVGYAGGGGGGRVRFEPAVPVTGPVPVVVGAGGAVGTDGIAGGIGGTSSFGPYQAGGGGGGGSYKSPPTPSPSRTPFNGVAAPPIGGGGGGAASGPVGPTSPNPAYIGTGGAGSPFGGSGNAAGGGGGSRTPTPQGNAPAAPPYGGFGPGGAGTFVFNRLFGNGAGGSGIGDYVSVYSYIGAGHFSVGEYGSGGRYFSPQSGVGMPGIVIVRYYGR